MQQKHAAFDAVLEYHQRTKHQFHRYAAGPGQLDWASQPDPFRTFDGCPRLQLPSLNEEIEPRYVDLYRPGTIAPQPLTLANIAALLELSFGISAWKQYGEARWALRCNPSSGNLHPTEAYVVVEGCTGIAGGVHHYISRDHMIEHRCRFAESSSEGRGILLPGSLLIGMSSIHWREAWKYGERAFRYCQHDVGHAVAAVRYAAARLGWQVRWLAAWGDADIAAVLGLDRNDDFRAEEREHADVMLQVTAASFGTTAKDCAPGPLASAAKAGQWQGEANVLSAHHSHRWPVIDAVAGACAKPGTSETDWHPPALPAPIDSACGDGACEIIRRRRSAQAFDGKTSLSAAQLYRILDMTLPRAAVAPWDTIAREPRIHLLLFVHRVSGLAPGLYLFLRNDHVETALYASLSDEFEWLKVADAPAHFAMFRLVDADAKEASRALSCHQDIAADGVFSVGMLGEFEIGLIGAPWHYRHLFWEAGMLGQVLYLEAEAAGMRGTGIGCYFDDAVHDLLGLQGRAVQSMYHFTVGRAIDDPRLQP